MLSFDAVKTIYVYLTRRSENAVHNGPSPGLESRLGDSPCLDPTRTRGYTLGFHLDLDQSGSGLRPYDFR